jgi:hypothetical protein
LRSPNQFAPIGAVFSGRWLFSPPTPRLRHVVEWINGYLGLKNKYKFAMEVSADAIARRRA